MTRVCVCKFRTRRTRLEGWVGRDRSAKLKKGFEGWKAPGGKDRFRRRDRTGSEWLMLRSRVEPDGSAIVCRS